jgi:hypothetical protein
MFEIFLLKITHRGSNQNFVSILRQIYLIHVDHRQVLTQPDLRAREQKIDHISSLLRANTLLFLRFLRAT